ncbi:hypothetical protein IFM89_010303 [Coptis chinensis]|uniref:PRA1 family protein n=1 Tax=Coptis chinensis TaxID=261450 RepID=A0A835H491_9MAGN|nr:hypothetical protein IFM89_010303 [Coptis chinensis]
MASAPPLPISNPQSNSNSNPNPTQTTTSLTNPAFKAFLTRLTDSTRLAFSHRRPWYELIDRSAFTRPESISESINRIRKNYSYFKINYITLLASVLALSLLSHPFSLITLVLLLSAWLFLYFFRPSDSPLVVFNRQFSDREILGILLVSSVVVMFLTSVGSVLIWGIVIGVGIICGHGAFRVPEDLFLDEQETVGLVGSGGSSGFLSFLGGAASSAAAAAAAGPGVASRV